MTTTRTEIALASALGTTPARIVGGGWRIPRGTYDPGMPARAARVAAAHGLRYVGPEWPGGAILLLENEPRITAGDIEATPAGCW